MPKAGIGICIAVIGGLIVFVYAMTYANKITPDHYLYHMGSEAEEWANYYAEQNANIAWMVGGSAMVLVGLVIMWKAVQQPQKKAEKAASDQRIRELEEKVKQLEAQKK